MIERFKNEKIAVNTRTQEEYNELMELLEKHNINWSLSKATKNNNWTNYKEKTCIRFCYGSLSWCDVEYYRDEGFKIIKFKDFIKGVEMKKKFTKKDLKDGDIITLRDGSKGEYRRGCTNINGLWDLNINNDLTNNGLCGSDLDIVKVERTTKTEVVYERKKEILDEAEKRYLRDVIRPFRNKINYIYKGSAFDEEYIDIDLKEDDIFLPKFKKGTMYKGMRTNKRYSLKELDL